MTDDIRDSLREIARYAFGEDETSRVVAVIRRQADEIAHLRALITAWADACDLMMKVGTLDTTTPEGVAAGQALFALRKAVGR